MSVRSIFVAVAVILCAMSVSGFKVRTTKSMGSLLSQKKYKNLQSQQHTQIHNRDAPLAAEKGNSVGSDEENSEKEQSVFDQVASKGLAGVLAIAVAEAIFWALGVPFAELWVKYSTGEWIDFSTQEGQLQAAGFSFGYGGFATLILQYRVTLFAIPLVPIMEKFVVTPGKKYFGEKFGDGTQ